MLLSNLLHNIKEQNQLDLTKFNPLIKGLSFDSKEIKKNFIFFAIKGTKQDGHQFINEAIKKGAILIIIDNKKIIKLLIRKKINFIFCKNSRILLSKISSNFYPRQPKFISAVTGTNGKTSVLHITKEIWKNCNISSATMGTIGLITDNFKKNLSLTTMDSIKFHQTLYSLYKKKIHYVCIETSSHGLEQNRVDNVKINTAAFTNFSHDHLDYHDTFAEYRDVKKSFFDNLPKDAFALVNIDDKNGLVMLQNTKARKITYALKTYADYKAQILENQLGGLLLKVNESEVWTRLIGNFNAYNILAIYATAELLGLEKVENLRLISELESVSGRFQYLISDEKITAIVDYAHTPDALQNVLETINSIRTKNEELITVVGCGGDRDKTKRPKMGHIASALSTKVIFTSDNPRSEVPETIIEEIEKGVEPQNFKKIVSIVDRKQAIKTACQLAQPNDIILIAGKGHETYQEIKGERFDFDDYKIVKEFLKQLQK